MLQACCNVPVTCRSRESNASSTALLPFAAMIARDASVIVSRSLDSRCDGRRHRRQATAGRHASSSTASLIHSATGYVGGICGCIPNKVASVNNLHCFPEQLVFRRCAIEAQDEVEFCKQSLGDRRHHIICPSLSCPPPRSLLLSHFQYTDHCLMIMTGLRSKTRLSAQLRLPFHVPRDTINYSI